MSKRVAIVHDWLITYGGAERVLQQMLEVFPQADIFSLMDFFPEEKRQLIFNKKVTTSMLHKLPFVKNQYRYYLPLMPLAIEQFDLSDYNIVISSSYAVAKGVLTGPDQLHICMCYSPMRYIWDLQHQYLRASNLYKGIGSFFARCLLHYVRLWDVRTAHGVDTFIAISHFVARRIRKAYRRESTVIYPGVDIDNFCLHPDKEDFYLTASRMVPYKKMDLIVDAFARMPDRKLVVIGDGPDWKKVRAKTSANVKLLGYQPFDILKDYMQRARAFIFAAEEDFGIVPVEAQACGTPVIAYGRGGSTETVLPGKTGLFFWQQNVADLQKTIDQFEQQLDCFDPKFIRENVYKFSRQRFHREFAQFVNREWDLFTTNNRFLSCSFK